MKTVTELAQKIADQELEACIEWLWKHQYDIASVSIRAARRPVPQSLADQALEALNRGLFGVAGDADTILRALERLQELEGNG